jgi:trk system potassium uptake protein TrkH
MANTRTAPAVRVGTIHVLPKPFGIGAIIGGTASLAASFVGLLLDRDDALEEMMVLLLVGAGAIVGGRAIGRFQDRPNRISPPMAMSMLVAGWMGAALVALIAFALSGEFESIPSAFFEAVSATTTTGFTTIVDPQELTHAMRFLRVALPWLCGLGVLIAGMGVLPVAIAGIELSPSRGLRRSERLVTTTRQAVRNIFGMYLLLTAGLLIGFLLGGMGPFDALSYALSTASTGGMSNHAASIGHFDSDFIDWVATIGMVAAGGSLVIVWAALRGAWDSVLHSTELRLYLSLLVLGFLGVWLVGDNLSVTDAAFSVSSMLSTTGLRSGNWAAGGSFTQAILLIGAGIGAMTGSVGSGFRLARVVRVALEVRRSLRGLLYPHRIGVIRIDGEATPEPSLERTYGYLWAHLITLTTVAVLVNVSSLDLMGTLTFSLSLISNVGVVLTEDNIAAAVVLDRWSQTVAIVGMVLGRLSIYPVLVTVAGFGRWLGRFRPHRSIGGT